MPDPSCLQTIVSGMACQYALDKLVVGLAEVVLVAQVMAEERAEALGWVATMDLGR